MLDQFQAHIQIAAGTQRTAYSPQRTRQLFGLAIPRLWKKKAKDLLQSPAPHSSVVDRVGMFADEEPGEEGSEFFQALLSQVQKPRFEGIRGGFAWRRRGHSSH